MSELWLREGLMPKYIQDILGLLLALNEWLYFGIDALRLFYENDMRFLRQFV